VISQQTTEEDKDLFDVEIARQTALENSKVCAKCGTVNTKTKRVSVNENCKCNLKAAELSVSGQDQFGMLTERPSTTRKVSEARYHIECDAQGHCTISAATKSKSNIYDHVTIGHSDIPPTLSVTDPCFVNPNSYASCRDILRQIGLESGIRQYGKGDREWLFVVCDGLPFGLCHTVIKNTFRCTNCDGSAESFFSSEDFEDHHSTLETGSPLLKHTGHYTACLLVRLSACIKALAGVCSELFRLDTRRRG
jgi:hypothetical protein